MKVHLDCFPCFLRQAIIALRLGTKDEVLQQSILKNTLEDIRSSDTSKPPAYTTTFIHRKIRHELGIDPFKDIKSEYNKVALTLYQELKRLIERSPDPLWTSIRLAIAGNVIDFGIFTSVEIEGSIHNALNNQLAKDDYIYFRKAINGKKEILYLTDNAGEIVFDRLFIETLINLGKRVKVVVKGSPVINDATRDDAEEAGLMEICKVVDNGSDAVGTIFEWTSLAFRNMFSKAQIIVSKGQGNYETLIGCKKNIFFLFQSKCGVVSKVLNLSKGSMLLMKS